jgi:hypothetical protein
LAKELLDESDGLEIEVVGWFVKEQDVRATRESEEKLETSSLAAGQF